MKNKFGAESHRYQLFFKDGGNAIVDVANEEQWGDIQMCTPEDCENWVTSIGYGNDFDGHRVIVKVIDLETGAELEGCNVGWWYDNEVSVYADNYSA